MEIVYLGHSSFKIRGKTATVITDPFSSQATGFKFPKTEADIVTISHRHEDHNNIQAVTGNPFVVSGPGEYEIKGVSIFGFPSLHAVGRKEENTIYLLETENLRLCHLGDLGVLPDAKGVEEIIGVDILMIPVGGVYTIGPREATEVINKIAPLIVLPMHFKAPHINESQFGRLATVEEFLTQMGAYARERLEKLSITKDKLPEETKVILLEKKT